MLQQGKFQLDIWEKGAVHQPALRAFILEEGAVCPRAKKAHPCQDSCRPPGITWFNAGIEGVQPAADSRVGCLLHPQLALLPIRTQPSHTHHLLQARADREVWAQWLYLHFDHHATPAAAPGFQFPFGQLKGHARLWAGLTPLLHILLLWVAAHLCGIQAEPNPGKRNKPA